jgi:hypothetical protein
MKELTIGTNRKGNAANAYASVSGQRTYSRNNYLSSISLLLAIYISVNKELIGWPA